MSEKASGSCLCGEVRYSFDRDQVVSGHHCHCKDCQRVTGSGKATFVMVPAAAISLEGELKFFTVTGTDGSHVSRGFCPNCGSGVMSLIEELPEFRIVKVGGLDDSSWISINSSFWSSSAEHWSPVDENHERFEQNPAM